MGTERRGKEICMRTGHTEYATDESEHQDRRGFYVEHPDAAAMVKASLPRTCKPMSAEFRAQVRRLHRLGERPLAELLLEIQDRVDCKAWIAERVRKYSLINPQLLDALNASHFPTHAEVITIDGGRVA
jgi:hypothetical protein